MKYFISTAISLCLATLLSGCMMMGGMGGSDDKHASGMMKCGMMMGSMKHNSKEMKHDPNTSSAMKCGSGMKMDKNDLSMKKGSSRDKDYIISQRYCTQCHGFRDKNLYSANEWRPILARMMAYMKKTGNNIPDDYESIMINHYYGIDN